MHTADCSFDLSTDSQQGQSSLSEKSSDYLSAGTAKNVYSDGVFHVALRDLVALQCKAATQAGVNQAAFESSPV